MPGSSRYRSWPPHALAGRRAAGAAIVAACLAGLPAAAAADLAKVGGVYDISFGGVPFAEGKLSLVVAGDAYSAKVTMRPSAVARIFSSETVDAEAAGWLRDAAVVPGRYSLKSSTEEKTTLVKMALSGGALTSVDVTPRPKRFKDQVPIELRHWRNVLDPLSAIVMTVRDPAEATGPAGCARTLPVYDGWSRFDIPLSYKGTKTVETKSYHGTVVVCAARWVPIAGHRKNKLSVKFMQENRDLEVWLAPVGGTGVLVPFRIAVGTMRGTLVLEARDLKMTGPTITSAAAP